MKTIIVLIGTAILLGMSGCDWDHDHHSDRGGAYGGYYGEYPNHTYGHGEWRDGDRDHYWDGR